METVVQQQVMNPQKLKEICEEKRLELQKLCDDNKIPYQAYIISGLSLMPMVVLPIVFFNYPILNYNSVNYFVKYLSTVQAMNAGIHFGLSIAEHECQFDSINSSMSAKLHFCFSSVFLFTSFNLLSYGHSELMLIFMANNVGLLGLDIFAYKKKIAPKWMLKLKLICFFIQIMGTMLVYIIMDGQKLEEEPFYKYYAPKNQLQIKSNELIIQKEKIILNDQPQIDQKIDQPQIDQPQNDQPQIDQKK